MAFSLEELQKHRKSNCSSIQLSSNISELKSNILVKHDDSIDKRINQIAARNISTVAEAMKNGMSIIFIIDKSGSCSGLERITSNEIYNLLTKQKKKFAEAQLKVSVVLFDNSTEYVFDNQYANEFHKFQYIANGMSTSIYDAVYEVLSKYKMVNNSKNTIVAIMTDGFDNSSFIHNAKDTKRIIQECKNMGWEFIFLGANIDAKKAADVIGINYNNAANYSNTIEGVRANFTAIGEVIDSIHYTGSIKADWDSAINMNNRKQIGNSSGKILQLGGGHHE